MAFLPVSYLFDFSTPSFETLEDPQLTLQLLEEITVLCGFQVVGSSYKKFEPQGLTAMLLLAESHISIHTWPEKNLFCLDLFTCKGKMDFDAVLSLLHARLPGLELLRQEEINRTRQGTLPGHPLPAAF